jgi:hypothetical protein
MAAAMRSFLWVAALVVTGCGGGSSGPGPEGIDGAVAADGPVRAPDGPRTADGPVRPPDGPSPTPDAAPSLDARPALPALKTCVGHAFTADPAGSWNHAISAVYALGAQAHSAQDVLTTGGAAGTARFEYGIIFKDLEDEKIQVFLDACNGWQRDGVETTDGEGTIHHTFPALPYGIYDVRYEVVGDATVAPARLWVLPKKTHLVVYDIDGTLTTSDLEEIKQVIIELFTGSYTPEAYPSAAAMTRAWDQIGAIGVYLTGRPHWLARETRSWLDQLDFATGPVFLAATTNDTLPQNSGVGDFKLGLLESWTAQGFILDAGHGNATTDIYAYLGAGLAPLAVWIIGTHAGEQGTNAVTDGWVAHTAAVLGLPHVAQPFTR